MMNRRMVSRTPAILAVVMILRLPSSLTAQCHHMFDRFCESFLHVYLQVASVPGCQYRIASTLRIQRRSWYLSARIASVNASGVRENLLGVLIVLCLPCVDQRSALRREVPRIQWHLILAYMPAKLVKSGSNVADLITSAGLLGNSLVKVSHPTAARAYMVGSTPLVRFPHELC